MLKKYVSFKKYFQRVQRLLSSTPLHLMIRMKKRVLVTPTRKTRKIREIRKKTKKLKKKAKNRKKRAKSRRKGTKRPKKTKRRRKRLSDKKLEDIKLLDSIEFRYAQDTLYTISCSCFLSFFYFSLV